MRRALFALPLLLAACNQAEEAPATNNSAEEISFEQEETGADVTAIDAATGADENMAPDEGDEGAE